MRRTKLWAAVLCGCTLTAMTASGCSSVSGNSVALSDTTFTGTVSEIDGSTITLSVSENGGPGGAPDMSQGGGQPDQTAGGADNSTGDSSDSTGNFSGNTGNFSGNTGNSSGNTDNSSDSTGNSSGSTDTSSGNTGNSSDSTDTSSGNTGNSSDSTGNSSGGSSDSDNTPPEIPDNAQNGQNGQGGGSAPSGAGGAGGSQPGGSGGASSDSGSSSMTVKLTLKDTSVLQDSSEKSAELSDIETGDSLTVTLDEDGSVSAVVIGDGQDQQSAGVDSYAALKEFTKDKEISGKTYDSTGTDENAIHIYNGASVTLDDVTATRNSSDSTGGDNSSFYGVGADLLVTDGTAYVKGGSYTTDAAGGAGIFAYGDGTAYVSDAAIKTTQDTSGGLHAAGGGKLYAWDVTAETDGNSSAAIRSDRGGGTMVIDGGSYTSNGTGSPAVYCTADIAVNNADLTANNSEGICIEGLNSLSLFDCNLSANMQDDEQNDCTWNIIVYQSMSGDSEVGNSTFQMTGGSITAANGGLLYTTNTDSTILLSDVDITYPEDSEFFLRCTGNNNQRGWGTSGANGATCNFTAASQEMQGDVVYDSISTLDFYMTDGSSLTGAFVDDESCAGNGGSGSCSVYISSDSTWTVTGDSTVTALYNAGGSILDKDGNTVTIKGTDGTVYVQGSGSYTITTGTYETSADLSGAATAGSFDNYAVEKPDALK